MESKYIKKLIVTNQNHDKQARETTFGAQGPGYNIIDPDNPNNHIEDNLDGIPIEMSRMSIETKQLLEELYKVTDYILETDITVKGLIDHFGKRKEKICSSYSGRHIGHYITAAKEKIVL